MGDGKNGQEIKRRKEERGYKAARSKGRSGCRTESRFVVTNSVGFKKSSHLRHTETHTEMHIGLREGTASNKDHSSLERL